MRCAPEFQDAAASLTARIPADIPTGDAPWIRTGDVLVCETTDQVLMVAPVGPEGRHRYIVFARCDSGPGDVIAMGTAGDVRRACGQSLAMTGLAATGRSAA